MRKNALYYKRRLLCIMAWIVDLLMVMVGIALVWAIFKGYATDVVYFKALMLACLASLFESLWSEEHARLYSKRTPYEIRMAKLRREANHVRKTM